MSARRSFFYIQLSFLIALMLSIIPFSENIIVFNPQWLVLVAAFWGIFTPGQTGIVTGWIWGLFLDVAMGTHLGVHALSLSLVCYMTVILHQRLKMYPLWQQAFFIWLLASLDKLVVYQLMNFFSPQQADFDYWVSSLISALFWPIMIPLMSFFHHKSRI